MRHEIHPIQSDDPPPQRADTLSCGELLSHVTPLHSVSPYPNLSFIRYADILILTHKPFKQHLMAFMCVRLSFLIADPYISSHTS